MSNRPEGAVAARKRRQRTETQRKMVLEYFQRTDNALAIERAFELFVAPGMRQMLYGDTPGHNAKGERNQREADEFRGYVERKYEG